MAEEHRSSNSLLIHVDVDAFFASVEQLLIPALRGRPVLVGNGVIASCSYEARRFGLHAGMGLQQARRKCPQAEILDGSYSIYRCFAEHVWEVCRRYTCGLETFLDEAYGDATGIADRHDGPQAMGRKLQQQVRDEVGLPVSVGLASNRMLAKIASAAGKPGGVVYIPPGQEQRYLAPLPIEKLLGVGPKTARQLRDMNVRTIGDLAAMDATFVRSMLGYRGAQLHDRANGCDLDHVRDDAPPRSISRETTFHKPTGAPGEIRGMLFYLTERATRAVRDRDLLAGRVELTVRYNDWKQYNACKTLPEPTDSENEIFAVVGELLERLHKRRVALRHVGVVLSKFAPESTRMNLFEHEQCLRDRRLHSAVDSIRDRWGHAAVVSGKSIELLGEMEQNDYGFVLRTPSLTK